MNRPDPEWQPGRRFRDPSRRVRAGSRRHFLRPREPGLRQRLYDIIFEAETAAGRWFDIVLLLAILASVALVSLETVPGYERLTLAGFPLPTLFVAGEWVLTLLFTLEYALRLACVRRPLRYAISFWGIVDLLSILPTYASLFIAESARSFVILRSIRLLRVFRVLKLWRLTNEADELADAIWRSREKIVVFLSVVLVAVSISATLMYYVETVYRGEGDPSSEFTSIPQAMYWAIVTMTTVGYGDVVPHTTAGKVISAALILLGYSLIIVPTGFVSAELSTRFRAMTLEPEPEPFVCGQCRAAGHRVDAAYCYRCGTTLQR